MSTDKPSFALFVDESDGPATATVEVSRTLAMAGFDCTNVANASQLAERRPDNGWAGAIVAVPDDETAAQPAWSFCRDSRKADESIPTLILINGGQLGDLGGRHEQFDDFLITPFHPSEFEARVGHLLWRSGQSPGPEAVEIGPLTLNLETYQATLTQRPLDLTYMEYELLKFLALSPGKVFSREVLLNRVWGYEYYGGARTVDVHVRRLRAKFGEEYAHLIQTVRSVGYKLEQTR